MYIDINMSLRSASFAPDLVDEIGNRIFEEKGKILRV